MRTEKEIRKALKKYERGIKGIIPESVWDVPTTARYVLMWVLEDEV